MLFCFLSISFHLSKFLSYHVSMHTGLRWSILTLSHSVKTLHLSPVCIVLICYSVSFKQMIIYSNLSATFGNDNSVTYMLKITFATIQTIYLQIASYFILWHLCSIQYPAKQHIFNPCRSHFVRNLFFVLSD